MAKNPYTNLYPSGSKEIDLRVEMDRTLYGAPDEEAKGRIGLLRKMRINDEGNLTRCPCRHDVTDEPDKDYYCRSCLGMGFFWDEYQIVYYRSNDSFDKNHKYRSDFFYLEYDEEISSSDYIVLVALNVEGEVIEPVQRTDYFKIDNAINFRSNNGRVEYWRIRASEERNWSTWYGVTNRQEQ